MYFLRKMSSLGRSVSKQGHYQRPRHLKARPLRKQLLNKWSINLPITLCLCFKTIARARPFVRNYEFYWHGNERRNSFSYKWFCIETRFDTGANYNLKRAYWLLTLVISFFSLRILLIRGIVGSHRWSNSRPSESVDRREERRTVSKVVLHHVR